MDVHEPILESGGDWERWLDNVFERVRAEIGGAEGQHGEARRYGEAAFGMVAEATSGDAVFVIFHDRAIHVAPLRPITVDWRSYQPTRVAEMLVLAYSALADVVRNDRS